MKINNLLLGCFVIFISLHVANGAEKPKITLDDFFNFVGFDSVTISPDGKAVVIVTDRADWDQKIFRTDLWLYRENSASLIQLTQTGHERHPEWSPDGAWIAFIAERKTPTKTHSDWKEDSEDDESREDETAHLYLISPNGGEAIQLTRGEEDIHAFTWSPDSKALYFATRQPWTKQQKDSYRKEWKDVRQYRVSERGDTIFSLGVADGIVRQRMQSSRVSDDSDNTPDITPGSRVVAQTPWRVNDIDVSPDGRSLAFLTESVSERQERISEFEIYTVDLANALPDRPPYQVTHNEALEDHIRWAKDSRHIFFGVELGSVEGKYLDTQNRLYWADAESGRTERWGSDFPGSIPQYYPTSNSGVLAAGRVGTEVQIYSQTAHGGPFSKQLGWPGTYDLISSAEHSPQIAFVYSALDRPTEVYLADRIDTLSGAKPITSFNHLFTELDLPRGKPYRWTADDNVPVEGMLMYPPGRFEAKNLPMFVFIHGGPADADGNHFEADWYQWDRLAATQGWLVFEPNYRGSSGYGDKFLEQIVPQMVSRPGKDILEGVDALVKGGVADPNHLAIGCYSYGGYMTNWLITQTTRFNAAVTGAGAVEHVANWGNDDTTLDDAYFLGGTPWQTAQRYRDEAAIFLMDKVRTPTHIVAGGDDIRVAVAEDYLLDRALHNLGIPSTLLIFPGEGHSLDRNPWHGKIKVREELKWLSKYGGISGTN